MSMTEIARRFPASPPWLATPDADNSPDPTTGEEDLEDAARGERDYVRERLREELGREPTEPEIDEWLQQQTEGY